MSELYPHAAKHVGRVGDVERGRRHAVRDRRTALTHRSKRGLLLLARAVGAQGRKQAALLRIEVLARLAECCLRGIDIGIGLQ